MATLEDAVRNGLEAAKIKLDNGATMVKIGKTKVGPNQTYAQWKLLFDARWNALQKELSTEHGVRMKVIHPVALNAKVFIKFAPALSGRNGSSPDLEDVLVVDTDDDVDM